MSIFEYVKENNLEALRLHLTSKTLQNRDEQGNTLLMIAAQKGNYGLVKVLLECGSNRGLTNNAGKTAYDLAFEEKRTLVMKLFLTQ
jgi:ankyrin repeat protein